MADIEHAALRWDEASLTERNVMPDFLLDDSVAFANQIRTAFSGSIFPITSLHHERLLAPHVPEALKPGLGVIYVYSLSNAYCEASGAPRRVLKVGRTDGNQRFRDEHYLTTGRSISKKTGNPKGGSRLARSICAVTELWRYLGISQIEPSTVKAWMLANLDRDHFFLSKAEYDLSGPRLETFIRGVLGVVYEGSTDIIVLNANPQTTLPKLTDVASAETKTAEDNH